MASRESKRLWELDIIRCIALLCMVVQHTTIVWLYMTTGELRDYPKVFSDIGRVGALLFLFLVGMSGYLSYAKRAKTDDFHALQKHFLVRGAIIAGWGVLVSVISFIIIPSDAIWFGVLSFIGTAIITLPLFIQYKWLSRSMIFIAIVIGALTSLTRVTTYAWLPVGLQPTSFNSLDYWPYFPWIALVLTGVEVARVLSTSSSYKSLLFSTYMPGILRPWQWLGSHTLLIYLLHVPIIAVVIWLLQRFII